MIAEEKKKQLSAAFQRLLEDEQTAAKLEAFLQELLATPPGKPKAGFMQGTVKFLTDDWDAPLPDDYWKHNRAE